MGLFGNNDRLNTARYNLEQYEKTKPADYQSTGWVLLSRMM